MISNKLRIGTVCLGLSRSGTLRLDLRLLQLLHLPDPRSSSEAVLVSQQVHTHVHMYPMGKKNKELCRHQLALSNNSHETSFSEEVLVSFWHIHVSFCWDLSLSLEASTWEGGGGGVLSARPWESRWLEPVLPLGVGSRELCRWTRSRKSMQMVKWDMTL